VTVERVPANNEAERLQETIDDINRTLVGTEEEFGLPADFRLEELGEVVESRDFFEARRQAIVSHMAGESLTAARRAA